MGVGLPAAADFVLVIAVQGLFLVAVLHAFGSRSNERVLIAFAAGLCLPIAAFGLISELSLPLTVLPDLAFVVFLRMLWKQYEMPSNTMDETRARGSLPSSIG